MGNLCGGGGNKPAGGGSTKPLLPQVEHNDVIKILLLGSGESGKSTLFKQIKIIENKTFSEDEIKRFSSIIYLNILQTIDALLTIMEEDESLNLHLKPENEEIAQRMKSIFSQDDFITRAAKIYQEEYEEIEQLAKDPAILTCLEKKGYEAHIFEGANYFFKDLERIRPKEYKPTHQDILYCRSKTTGITELNQIDYNGYRLKIIDVGGQAPERNKWHQAYEGATAVVFVASLGDYDQLLYEDDKTNRMIDSIDLFDEVINSRLLKDVNVILLLNKRDVFEKKIKTKSIKTLFPEYTGTDDFEHCAKYIEKLYLDKNKYKARIDTYYTCATETENIRDVFGIVKDKLIEIKQNEKKKKV
ncbi:hypothetical protein ABK040_002045 [Willaertia magna]